MSTKKRNGGIRAVIVGCGRIAGGYNEYDESRVLTHVMAYRQLGVQVAGCCDVVEEKAQAFAERWTVPVNGSDLRKVLEDAQPQVVSLCTPPEHRMEPLRAIMALGSVRAILVEKPLATRGRDAEEIATMAKAWGRPVMVDFFRSFDPFYRRLVKECAAGRLGVLQEVVARYYGSAWNNASHLLERVLEILGEPTSARRLSGDDSAPLFELSFGTGGARALFLPTSGLSFSPLELDLFFSKGRIRVMDSEQRVERFVSRPSPLYNGYHYLGPVCPRPTGHPCPGALVNVVRALLRASRGQALDPGILTRAVSVTQILEAVGAC